MVHANAFLGLDTSRLTVVYFATLGLDIIGTPLEAKDRDDVVSFIYSLQVSFLSEEKAPECNLTGQSGFLGSSYLGLPYSSDGYDLATLSSCLPTSDCHCADIPALSSYIQGHIAMTYCSVLTLHALGDDFSRLNKVSILLGNWSVYMLLSMLRDM
jgi:hypothetical protein